MEFFETLNTRISTRDYDPSKPVSKEVLIKILEAGNIAPTAANKQPFRFLLVSSNKMLEKVRPCYHREWFKQAPHILVIVGKNDEAWVRKTDRYNSVETDVTIAMDHMILAAHALGVSSCWIAAFDNEILRDALNLNDNEVVYSITPLGYPKNSSQKINKIRKQLDEVAVFL